MKLTSPQLDLLAKVGADWARLPPGVSSTNATLAALEKRDWVETRLAPNQPYTYGYGIWEVRLNPRRKLVPRSDCSMCRNGTVYSLNSGKFECPACITPTKE